MTTNDKLNDAITEVAISQMAGKPFYKSKTVWANIVASIAIGIQFKYGFIITPEVQTLVLAAINMWLRTITKEEIIW